MFFCHSSLQFFPCYRQSRQVFIFPIKLLIFSNKEQRIKAKKRSFPAYKNIRYHENKIKPHKLIQHILLFIKKFLLLGFILKCV